MIKDDHFRDNPPNPVLSNQVKPSSHRFLPVFQSDRPEVHELVLEMRAVIDDYSDRVLIGEIYLPIPTIDGVLRQGFKWRTNCHLIFSFFRPRGPQRLLARAISEYDNAPSGWCLAELGPWKSRATRASRREPAVIRRDWLRCYCFSFRDYHTVLR